MRKAELDAMSPITLIQKLMTETSEAHQIRNRLNHLAISSGGLEKLLCEAMQEIGYNVTNGMAVAPAPAEKSVEELPDFRDVMARRKTASTLEEFTTAIYRSEWDLIDLRKRMYSSPYDVREFLEDHKHFAYQDLSPGEQAYINTIAHSWGYWLNQTGMLK